MSPQSADASAPAISEDSTYREIIERLHALPEEFNPAIRLDYELSLLEAQGKLTLMMLIAKRGEIEFVTELGEQEIKRTDDTIRLLGLLPTVAQKGGPPPGF